MANITINEISQSYTYNIGNNSYATVALPITACWGPGFVDSSTHGYATDDELESVTWQRFNSNQAGLEAFISTYRGPATQYLSREDYSYQIAMTLLTSGYDILVCRLASGTEASQVLNFSGNSGSVEVRAKYPGTFGNQLECDIKKLVRTINQTDYYYWNCVVYLRSSDSIRTALENLSFVFDVESSSEAIPHISEIESKFIEFCLSQAPETDENVTLATSEDEYHTWDSVSGTLTIKLAEGNDTPEAATKATSSALKNAAIDLAQRRYYWATQGYPKTDTVEDVESDYVVDATDGLPSLSTSGDTSVSIRRMRAIVFREWIFNSAFTVLRCLEDRLAYNPNRIIVPGWDDQDYRFIKQKNTFVKDITDLSPLHVAILDAAYKSRCATGYVDIPKSISRAFIYNEEKNSDKWGYSQRLARSSMPGTVISGSYYSSHSALFAPWGKYTYVGTGKQAPASPSVLALLIDRAMIKNQTSQYEWQLPTVRRHNLRIGKMDYTISKKYLDIWQSLDGVSLNCITQIPDLGLSIWGNSTLFEVPPATYQAMANLSTRKLVNAIEDLAYRCGISITFQYNNEQAYNAFYAGMTPLLDTMRNVGAIEDYYLRMAEDVNGLDNVNANSVIGKIYLVIDGVINDINIDLIALPPTTSLDEYRV